MSDKSSLLSDDAASSSSEDMSSTAGCKEVMCVRRAYANSHHRGVASCIHLRRSLCRTLGRGVAEVYANSHHRGVASCIHLRRSLCRI